MRGIEDGKKFNSVEKCSYTSLRNHFRRSTEVLGQRLEPSRHEALAQECAFEGGARFNNLMVCADRDVL